MLIAITGKKESGKTTFANFLKEEIESRHTIVRILSFSSALKQMLETAEICSYKELYEEKTNFSRDMLQKIGTNIIRNQIDEEFWTKRMRARILGLREAKPPCTIIIDDVRFVNEEAMVREFGGTIIKMVRNWLENSDKHRSETEMAYISEDILIQNDFSLSLLKEKAQIVRRKLEDAGTREII